MKPSKLFSSALKLALLLAGIWLAGCSAQPAPSGVEPIPPTQTGAPGPAATTPAPSPTPAPSSTPADTPTPPATATPDLLQTESSLLTAMPPAQVTDAVVTEEVAGTVVPPDMPPAKVTDAALPVEVAGTVVPPVPGGVSIMLTNGTNKMIYVQGYGVTKSIPAGLTIYFQIPNWGPVNFKVCKSAVDGVLGGCYVYKGTISANNPSVLISR